MEHKSGLLVLRLQNMIMSHSISRLESPRPEDTIRSRKGARRLLESYWSQWLWPAYGSMSIEGFSDMHGNPVTGEFAPSMEIGSNIEQRGTVIDRGCFVGQ